MAVYWLFAFLPAEFAFDELGEPFAFFEHEAVLKSQNFDPEIIEKEFSFGIVGQRLIAVVNLAVQLDGKPFGWTIEIQDIRPDAMLSAKLTPVEI